MNLSKTLKRVCLTLIFLLFIPSSLFLGMLGFAAFTEYKPKAIEESIQLVANGKSMEDKTSLQITTFNIGYCGLDKSQDFFMDGGKGSRAASKEQVEKNLSGVLNVLKKTPSDIFLLQEVDESADRSFQIDLVDIISNALPWYNASFAYNYRVKWVPVPWRSPMGAAESGIMTLSVADSSTSTRYSLPGLEPLPKRFFDLKRCVMETVYTLKNGKELIVMNVHLSAFDEQGVVRAEQMQWLQEYIEKKYNPKKNYIILGGDWNHLMDKRLLSKIQGEIPAWIQVLPDQVTSTDFKVVYDDRVNSVRALDKPYEEGKTLETIIDGFIVSPNVTVKSVKTHQLGFEHSDHQPVTAVFQLD